MTQRIIGFGLSVLMMAAVAWAGLTDNKVQTGRAQAIGGSYDPIISTEGAVARAPRINALDDLVGTNYQAGTTWYDYQHNGTAGHMIGVDDLGFVHVVWMNGLDQASVNRHVYYNVWDPTTETYLFAGGGQQVDNSTRAGYTNQATMGTGFSFPDFHAYPPTGLTDSLLTGVSIDFLPSSGAFTTAFPERPETDAAIWPKIALGPDSILHVVSTTSGDPQEIYYARGTANFDAAGFGLDITWDDMGGGEGMELIDASQVISADVAASSSGRVALAWNRSRGGEGGIAQINNDLVVRISEDNGLTWGPDIDITQWIPADINCASGDTLTCNMDTLRPYTDLSILFDNDDVLHVTFTTRTFFEVGYPEFGAGPLSWIDQSGIWHWSEDYQEFSPIVSDYYFMTVDDGANLMDPGAWQLNVQRPNLSLDPTTGFLYCSFMRYDSSQYSENFFPMADAWVTVSCSNGRMWAEPINVTNTIGGEAVPAGQTTTERDITLATEVSYSNGEGYLHMQYIFDLDAGGVPQSEGVATLCPVYYQRIPVDSIPLTPYVDPFHKVMHVDSTGMPGRVIPLDPENPCLVDAVGDDDASMPRYFTLHQNYPNPFNPSTKIQFDLVNSGRVTLSVFNVLGQETARLIDNESMTAGVHLQEFDASGMASGVYIYKLSVDGVSSTRKMVLMK